MTVAREALRARPGCARDRPVGRPASPPWPRAELAAGDPERAGPRARRDRLPRGGPGRPVRGPARRERRRRARSPPQALEAGAWGVLVGPEHRAAAVEAAESSTGQSSCADATAIVAPDPLRALQLLARAWRRELGCPRGRASPARPARPRPRTSSPRCSRSRVRTHANRENFNTEIGLPLTLLEADRGTEALVLEMAMRGEGQIAELAEIAEPDVGVIVNVGPVHLELLGTVERVAAAKAELIRDLRPGAACVVPGAASRCSRPTCATTSTPGPSARAAQVQLLAMDGERAEIEARGERDRARAALSRAPQPRSTRWPRWPPPGARSARGRRRGRAVLVAARRGRGAPGGVVVVNDCYNANPMSMRAALDHLAGEPGRAPDRGAGHDGRARHRTRRSSTARSARTRRRAGSTCWCRWARTRSPTPPASTARRSPWRRPRRRARCSRRWPVPGDRVLVKGSRSVGPGAGAQLGMLGEILIGGLGLAAHLHVPRAAASSTTCASRSSASRSARRGPAGHHGKAGTPTMGGLVIFLAIAVPFLILSEYRAASLAVLGTALAMAALGFADDIDQAAQAPLAGRVGAHEAARPGAHRDRAVARGDASTSA